MKVSEINRKAFWEAVVSAGASLASGLLGSDASKDAAKEAKKASKYATDKQQEMYNQSREDTAPWRETGEAALNELTQMTGTGTDWFYGKEPWEEGFATYQEERDWLVAHRDEIDAGTGDFGDEFRTPEHRALIEKYIAQLDTMDPADRAGAMGGMDDAPGPPGYEPVPEFEESPGYQFTLQQGLDAQQNALSAMGANRSGKHIKAATQYAEGLASTEYDNFLNRWYRDQGEKRNAFASQINPYLALSGQGQVATSNLGQLGGNAASGMGNAAMYGGNAQATGKIQQSNALTGAISGGVNNLLYANSLRNLNQQQTEYTGAGYGTGAGGYGQSAGYK